MPPVIDEAAAQAWREWWSWYADTIATPLHQFTPDEALWKLRWRLDCIYRSPTPTYVFRNVHFEQVAGSAAPEPPRPQEYPFWLQHRPRAVSWTRTPVKCERCRTVLLELRPKDNRKWRPSAGTTQISDLDRDPKWQAHIGHRFEDPLLPSIRWISLAESQRRRNRVPLPRHVPATDPDGYRWHKRVMNWGVGDVRIDGDYGMHRQLIDCSCGRSIRVRADTATMAYVTAHEVGDTAAYL